MKLRTKIILGFGVILAILVLMGVISLLQFQSAASGFTAYRGLARDTNLAGELQANMLMVRMNVKDFIITGSEKDHEQYSDYLVKMNGFLDEAQAEIQNPERAALIDRVSETVTGYESAFNEVYKIRDVRNELVNKYLAEIGAEMETDLSALINTAAGRGDSEIVYYGSLTLRSLLMGRIYVAKFLEDNKHEYADMAERELKAVDTMIGNALNGNLTDQGYITTLRKISDSRDVYTDKFLQAVEVIERRNSITAEQLDVFGPQIAGWVEDVKLSIKTEQDALGPVLAAENDRAKIMIIILLAFSVCAGVGIALFTISSVLKQLGADPAELMNIAEAIAAGDLTGKESAAAGDLKGVYASMISMKENLTSIVSTVLAGSTQIASASEQLASGNQDLSNRTEQQASALEETSSAIEEMNASIKSNADNTVNADQLSREAVTKTEEGSRTVGEMVTSMDEINVSSNRIADIIEVITNIAFQTNLLALNASIEAARAGEQGKGFAVVAVEVRKLAKRSDRAAKEITDIIKNSNRKVTEGVEIANRAGEVLQEINAAVRKVTTLVGEISAASQEQLSSADQIDKTLSSLDENTQKNAALVEEAASATEELSAQAQELNSAMQFFRLDGRAAKRSPGAAALHHNAGINAAGGGGAKTGAKAGTVKNSGQKSKTTAAAKKALPDLNPENGRRKPASDEVYQSFSDLADEGEFDEF